jgi:hypothetical protein
LTLMRELGPHVVVQGNRDPLLLVSGGAIRSFVPREEIKALGQSKGNAKPTSFSRCEPARPLPR